MVAAEASPNRVRVSGKAKGVKGFLLILAGTFFAALAVGTQAPTGRTSVVSAPAQGQDNNEIVRAAMEALQRGDFQAAIPQLEKLTRIAPDVPEYQADLGMAYYSVGRAREAIAPCRKALSLKPGLTASRSILAVSLAESGECKEALPSIEKAYPALGDRPLRRIMGIDGARCAMSSGEPFRAINFLLWLNRDYANDPDVLYLSTQVFSDLSIHASQRLLRVAPGSYQARQLDAETLEVEGKNSDALAEYRSVLAIAPQVRGIHYHIGRLLLSEGHDSGEEARKEFEAEIAIDPDDAASEYELGEMARESRKWDEAVQHFGRAAKIDSQFAEALVGLGRSLVSGGRASEAVAPLEGAVKLEPSDPVAHYQLSFAYLRVGREEDAKKELALYREAHDRQQRDAQAIRQGITGSIAQPQTAEPPE